MVLIQIRRGSPTDPQATLLAPGEQAVDYSASRAALYIGNEDGTHNDRTNGGQAGRFLRRVVKSGSDTSYVAGTGAVTALIRMIGGGGGGGGIATFTSNSGGGAGGPAGGFLYVQATVTAGTSYTCAIGAAGTGGAAGNNAGTAGGATTLTIGATTYTANGGGGGAGGNAVAVGFTLGGAPAAVSTNGDLNLSSMGGMFGFNRSTSAAVAGFGGSCEFGNGGAMRSTHGNGNNALGYGGGGGGGCNISNGGNVGGGNGTGGVIVIDEYSGAES
jgi:hypothetical protein